jgi:MFS family permease
VADAAALPFAWPLRRRVAAFAILMAAEFLYGWSWGSIDVLRPQIRAELGISLIQAGAFYSAQAGGAILGALAIGQLADRFGRRNALVGVLVSIGVLLGAGVAITSYPAMLAQRFLLGIAMGGAAPVIGSLYIGFFAAEVRGRLASLLNAVFTGSVVGLSLGLALVGAGGWRTLFVVGAAGCLALAPVALLIPDERRGGVADAARPAGLPAAELFAPHLRRYTGLLILMAGCNYFAAQAFTGWTSSFLTDVRGLAAADVGAAVAAQATGSLIGGFLWGWFADRVGRKASVVGYVAAGALMVLYLIVIRDASSFRLASFGVGFAIAASVIWPPWMAEIFPEALRATALSIFNWGRIVSLFAPLVTGAIAERHGLGPAMLLGPAALLVVAVLWRLFPETLRRKPALARS